MIDEDRKMVEFGRMMFGMIQDVLLTSSRGDSSYGRKTVTMPDGSGGKHKVVVMVLSDKATALAAEKGIELAMDVKSMAVNETEQ